MKRTATGAIYITPTHQKISTTPTIARCPVCHCERNAKAHKGGMMMLPHYDADGQPCAGDGMVTGRSVKGWGR